MITAQEAYKLAANNNPNKRLLNETLELISDSVRFQEIYNIYLDIDVNPIWTSQSNDWFVISDQLNQLGYKVEFLKESKETKIS